ncbi:MAG: DUF4389 domain-containing protein [Polaromonas sp.]|nr:DUF4389 domain-containing protein [Polaromonas sp.]
MDDLTVPASRKLWVRLLLMLLLAAAFQLAASVLFFVAVLQLLLTLATDSPNARLRLFGRSLGCYLAQIADFESFSTEALPFPFNLDSSVGRALTQVVNAG